MKEILYMSRQIEELGHIKKKKLAYVPSNRRTGTYQRRKLAYVPANRRLGHIIKKPRYMSQRNVRTWKIIKEKEDPISTIEYPLVLWWEVWQDCQRWPARHLDTRRWEVQPILCAPVLIGMEVFGVKNGLAVKKRKYTVKYRKTTAP